MKNLIFLIIFIFLLISCSQNSVLYSDFNCDSKSYKNLENVDDLKQLFSISLPKNWKTNLYQDDIQSSIFSADTTKQLTETVLLDVSYINKNINFNDSFLLEKEQENLAQQLIKIKSKSINLFNKPSYYMVYQGKKGKFSYKTCHIYVKVNQQNFIFVKSEVYGDSLVNQRLCNSFSLIENINIHNKND